ncbi:hypothetical protein [Leucobacter sp. GX24907]
MSAAEQPTDLLIAIARAATDMCASAAARLREHGVPSEGLAIFEEPRRRFLRTRPARLRPSGRVWRLGTLLLDEDGSLHAAGRATRAAERGRPGYQSQSREERREIAAAALRGGYDAGEPVNFDARPLLGSAALAAAGLEGSSPSDEAEVLRRLPDDAPIGIADGELRVRWRPGAPLEGAAPLAQYLDERMDLIVNRAEA